MKSPQVMISRAESSDLEEILSLLNALELPLDGVGEHLGGFLVIWSAAPGWNGTAGLACFGLSPLRRSASVLGSDTG
jgi:hypothetical protein